MNMTMRIPTSHSLIFVFLLCTINEAVDADESINYTRDIRPIISSKCVQCHGPDEEKLEADLRLDKETGVAQAFRDGGEGIERIMSTEDGFQMPPKESHLELKPAEIELLKNWAKSGAPYASHWAFEKPKKPTPPLPTEPAWTKNEIDHFVLEHLKSAGLSPNQEADRERLIRRVTYDLTGLPPTINQINAFVNDPSSDAYEKVVDRLLASQAYGERMTLSWLDAARYGDTSVFHADGRRDMWAWRNWVIDAYNNNMPFDQFTIKQLAGDLIPNGTWQDKVASGFNRNHGTTDEGGAIAEEYRVEYVVDRVKTTSTIWLGLTMECAQCHSHKYDPISQKEYYQFYAFFNQTADPGMQTRNGNQTPIVNVPNEANVPLAEKAKAELEGLKKKLADHEKTSEKAFQEWLDAAAKSSSEATMPSGLNFHLKFDETKGKKVSDVIDAKRVGDIKGKPIFKSGKIGGAIELNGSTHVNFGQVNDFDRDDAFSISAWLLWNKKDGAIVSKMTNGGNYRGYDMLISGGHLEFHLVSTWPGDALKIRTKKKLTENKWQHICLTYDGSSKSTGAKIYFDGVLQQHSVEQDGLKSITKNDVPFLIGQRNNGAPLKGLIDDVRIYSRNISEAEVKTLTGENGLRELLTIESTKRTPAQNKTLKDHYFTSIDKTHQSLSKQLNEKQKQLADLSKPLTTVMIMQEMPKPRMTYVLDRGHYASPKKEEVIKPGVPAFLPPMDNSLPNNRLGLANWIVSKENPLTPRVTVNRYWQMFFGKGLVETLEDLGTQGNSPTHPALLDWLATDFVENGWNVKRTLKKIVMSATYRQASVSSAKKLELDPRNLSLSRGPRFRLMGEFLRDGALAAAGLLNEKVGGPSAKPYQPPGLWNEVSLNGGLRFKRDSGENLYRKSMYIYWRRSAPMPSMAIFGTPSRDKCIVRRAETNTPLQALVTLNDEQFVEAARFLAQRVLLEKKDSLEEQIIQAHRLLAGTKPSPKTLNLLKKTFMEEKSIFDSKVEEAKKLLATGEKKRDESIDAATHAAMTIVCGIIMNLDEALTRG